MEIMNVAVCEGLREIFKQEWDKHYAATKGVWDDTCKSGNELYNMEKSRRHAKPYLNSYQCGKRSEWDSSALLDAILYSNALGAHVAPHVLNKVDELRKLRNSLTHVHGPRYKISDNKFDNALKKIKNCFKVLKLSTTSVEKILNSWKRRILINFSKMTYICLSLFIAGLLSSATYYWYTHPITAKALTPFRILPVRPIHLVANRSRTVSALLEELRNLSIRNNQSLTYLYISGNPGSGKSQLARLVGQQYGLSSSLKDGIFDGIVFVMTLKATSVQNILESYADFARRVDCNDSVIANIINSSQTTTESKINSLKMEVAKIFKNAKEKYTWLLIVDNVVKLKEISLFLPHLEDEDWQSGQVLITTQDMSSVPPNSSSTIHISVSQGMNPTESCEFLTNLSGVVENQELVGKVAKDLDYQPLALASAAFYVKQLRESKTSPRFNWKDYLNKLDEGKRNLTEAKLSEINTAAYSLTMSTAVLLAVKVFATSDPVLKHAFTFLSFVSRKAIALEIVVSYILRVDKGKDKDDAGFRILKCSLILVSDDQKVVSILTHRVVHDCIKQYIVCCTKKGPKWRVPLHVLQVLLPKKPAHDKIIVLIPHLKAFYAKTKNLSSAVIVPHSMESKQRMQKQIVDLSAILIQHGNHLLSKNYLILSLNMTGNHEHAHVSFPKIGEIYNNLVVVETKLGNTKQAKKYLETSLEIFKRQHGPSHKSISACLINLASLCANLKDCSANESVMYVKEALSIHDSLENKAIYYGYLGNKYYYEHNFEQAKKNYVQAMGILKKLIVPGADSVRISLHFARIYSDLGALHHTFGNYKEAKEFLRLSVDTYLNFTVPNNVDLAISYYNLGLVHYKLKELTDAENSFRNSLAIYTQHLKSCHEDIARVYRQLVEVLEEKGQLDKAEVLYEHYNRCLKQENLGTQYD